MTYGIKVEKKTINGESVYLKSLSGGKNSARVVELLQLVKTEPKYMVELSSLLAMCCLCDESGNPVFEDSEQAGEKCSLGFMMALCEPALELSGLDDDAAELPKNSEAVQ